MNIEYLAGFFDAEGCVSVGGNGDVMWINVDQIDLLVLSEYQRRWGGCISSSSLPSGKTSYLWSPSSQRNQVQFLNDIIPFLILKRKTARLAKAFHFWRLRYLMNGARKDKSFQDVLTKVKRLLKESRHEYVYSSSRLKNSTISYFAGMFDGDGCLGLYDERIRAQFTQCDFPITEEFQRRWGGALHSQKCNSNSGNISYKWAIGAGDTEKFITDMLPYFVEKKELAKNLLDGHKRRVGSGVTTIVLISPKNEEHKILIPRFGLRDGPVKEFCKNNDLSIKSWSLITSGKVKYHRSGWRSLGTKWEYYFVVDPQGEVHQIRKYHGCCREFLERMNISESRVRHCKLLELVKGRQVRVKDRSGGYWTRFDLDEMLNSIEEAKRRLSLKHKQNDIFVFDLNLSRRTRNCLLRVGVQTLNQLIMRSPKQVRKIYQIGPAAVEEIESLLVQYR